MNPDQDVTPHSEDFQLPAFDAPRDVWKQALERMQAVELTWQQIHTGYSASQADDGRFGDIDRLRAWCQMQGLYPVDVVAATIMVRMSRVIEGMFADPDFDAADHHATELRDIFVDQGREQLRDDPF